MPRSRITPALTLSLDRARAHWPKRRKAVEALAEDMATFLREDMGHARSFNLDTDDTIRERVAIVRAL